MFSVFSFLFNVMVIPLLANGDQLGTLVTDKTTDVLFRDMGQAYVSSFGVVDTAANLQVVLEDTVGVDEFWVVDFQPFDKQPERLPVNANNGDIEPANTGSCSNVFIKMPFESILGAGRYFKDDNNFRTINISLTGLNGGGDMIHKRLFEQYIRGNVYNVTDQYGNQVQRRDDIIWFKDNFGYFFNCTDTDDQLIWSYSNTTDTIEYRTTIYVTNVRLRDRPDPNTFTGFSWVSSSIQLIYRIYRIAIVNFVISSSALVKPTLNYVIIMPFYNEVTSDREPLKAFLKMEFETLIESPDGELLSYIPSSLNYISRESTATLESVPIKDDSSSSGSPTNIESCTVMSGSRCRQTWIFYLVLELVGPLPVDELPIDATGTFSFEFDKYTCNDSISDNPSDCTVIPNINFTISLEVTIQTFVSMVNEHTDAPIIMLLTVASMNNGEDLRDGALGGRRGINHLENVILVYTCLPELLLEDFDLQLTLFMVCKQNVTDLSAGCLEAATNDRYVAYYHDDFKYIHNPREGEATTYELSDISDEWDPSAADDQSQQNLAGYEYNRTSGEYTISFTNTALSQERLTYTITTVYNLVPIIVPSDSDRRRRDVYQDKQILVKSELHPYDETHTRQKRDLLEAAEDPQGHSVMIDFVGCPARSTFNPQTLNCDCPDGELYSTELYECYSHIEHDEERVTYKPDVEVEEKSEDTEKGSSAAPIHICFALHFIVLLGIYFFTF